MIGSLLRSGKLTEFQALGDSGQKVFASAAQIRQAVQYKVGPQAADYLAIPQVNDKGDTIDWYAPAAGEVIPWSAATADERSQALAKLEQAQQALKDTAANLQLTDESAPASADQQLFARLLDKVIHFPSPEHVYIVNGNPVLTFWGFSAKDNGTENPLDWLRAAPLAATTAPMVSPPAEEQPQRRFPWWWLLLLLLLLLFLLWLMRSCSEEPAAPEIPPPAVEPSPEQAEQPEQIDQLPVLDQRQPRDVEIIRGTDRTTGTVTDAVIDPATGSTTVGNEEGLGGVEEGVEVGEIGTEVPGTEEQLDDPGTSEADALGDEDAAVPSDEPSPEPAPGPEPGSEQEPDLGSDPGSEPGSDTEQQPSIPPPEINPDRPDGLNIPPEAQQQGSTDFLNGGWQSNSGLQDTQTGQPMRVAYEFKDGQGKIRIYGGGLSCEGQTSASMQNGALTIGGVPVTCNDGTTRSAPKVTCQPGEGNQADCRGSYPGTAPFPVKIRKTEN